MRSARVARPFLGDSGDGFRRARVAADESLVHIGENPILVDARDEMGIEPRNVVTRDVENTARREEPGGEKQYEK